MSARTLVLIAGTTCLTACATYTEQTQSAVYGATLQQPATNTFRDMLRAYVYDVLGPDYIIEPDELTRINTLTARDRGRGQAVGRPIPVPDRTFRLELAETPRGPICRLVPPDDISEAPVLVLPDDVHCQLLPAVI